MLPSDIRGSTGTPIRVSGPPILQPRSTSSIPRSTPIRMRGYLMVRPIWIAIPRIPPPFQVSSCGTWPRAAPIRGLCLQTLEIVSPTGGSSWLDHNQFLDHKSYDANYLPTLCYGTDPQNSLSWARQGEWSSFPIRIPAISRLMSRPKLPSTLAAAGEVMRVRLRIPVTPPTPCTNGCSRSGNEQVRYVGLSFYPSSGAALASLADSYFTRTLTGTPP